MNGAVRSKNEVIKRKGLSGNVQALENYLDKL